MSFGALSANAIRALNHGAKKGGFAHDTGEGGISLYHREFGGDIIWEIGSGYFGCRTEDGSFWADRFAERAAAPQVKMIEIKLSRGAKPGHGAFCRAPKYRRRLPQHAAYRLASIAFRRPGIRPFRRRTLHALAELIAAAGLEHPNQLRPHHIMRRVSAHEVRSFAEIYPVLAPGELLAGSKHRPYARAWAMAGASFLPLPDESVTSYRPVHAISAE